jgi:hypothetical protein
MYPNRNPKYLIGVALFFCLFFFPNIASAQNYYFVDCSGNTPGAYLTIASLPPLMNGDTVQVTGTCTENVSLNRLNGVYFGAPWNQTMYLIGSLSITDSQNLFIYGMNISSASGDGIRIFSSSDIVLNSCTSNNNHGKGLSVDGQSFVEIENTGSYSNNGDAGINMGGHSFVTLLAWGTGFIDVSNNVGSGVYVDRSDFQSLGNVTIMNNKAVPAPTSVTGFGLDFRGASIGYLGGLFGPNTVANNQNGGISLQENAEISLWGAPNIIQGNGPTGISVGFGSQLTLYDGSQVLNHSEVGVDVFAKSQAYFYGSNQLMHNGFGSDPERAGLRIDGNSESFLRGGEISQNGGPGILALVNSSVDFSGVVFRSNAGGPIVCDSSAYMISDLTSTNTYPGTSLPCKVPHSLGNHRHPGSAIHVPDWSRYKAIEDKYHKLATLKH